MSKPYLAISGLSVHFHGRAGLIRAVDGFDLSLVRGERFGLIGESGSGKTMVALSLMGLLPVTAQRTGSICLAGRELTTLDPLEMQYLRGRKMAMIFEQPAAYLDPLFSIGQQIAEAVTANTPMPRRAAWQRTLELLFLVRMPEPERRARSYPFELSGGMQQRAMIAMALAGQPDLLLADEPTTALDPTAQAHILALLDEATRDTGMTLLLITHDLTAIRRLCQRVAVMYAGRVVETGIMEEVLDAPRHPYTRALGQSLSGRRLRPIAGNPPSLADLPPGCRFHPRCPQATARCAVQEPPFEAGVRCYFNHAT